MVRLRGVRGWAYTLLDQAGACASDCWDHLYAGGEASSAANDLALMFPHDGPTFRESHALDLTTPEPLRQPFCVSDSIPESSVPGAGTGS